MNSTIRLRVVRTSLLFVGLFSIGMGCQKNEAESNRTDANTPAPNEVADVAVTATPDVQDELKLLKSISTLPKSLVNDLKTALTGANGDRCLALTRIGDSWETKRYRSGGFTDLPVEPKPPVVQPASDDAMEAIGRVLQRTLVHSDSGVRQAAAICLCKAPRRSSAVDAAVQLALKSDDLDVLWYLFQLKIEGYEWPDPSPVVHSLIEALKESESDYAITLLMEKCGEKFVPHTKLVIESLPDLPKQHRWSVLITMADIGITEEAARHLIEVVEHETPGIRAAALIALLRHPDKAVAFLKTHRDIGGALAELHPRLDEVLMRDSSNIAELRELLLDLPGISPITLAVIGSERSLPELNRRWESASGHEKTLIRACIRACGGELGDAIHLSKSTPVVFKPTSAWPGHEPRRQSEELGHGDGFTPILITGEIKCEDGTHPDTIRFFRTNDGMLMGEGRRDLLSLRYDKKSGRFVLPATVFAAYSMGKPPEPGPYQTGSLQAEIEAPGCSPLVVQFFDEMPHVVIELPQKRD